MMRFAEFRISVLAALLAVSFSSRAAAQLEQNNPGAPAANASPVSAKTPAGKLRTSEEVQITGDKLWADTAIDVQPGEHIVISTSGKLRYSDAKEDNGPDGLPRGFKDLIRILPFNSAGRGALIGRIGDAETAQPFLLGAQREVVAPVGGRFSVGINESQNDLSEGVYKVRIEIYAPDATFKSVATKAVKSIAGVDTPLFSKIPRRVADKDGKPGDMVNFLILGSEDAMKNIFTSAGWVKVDADAKDSFLRGIIDSLSKESYVTMPMSQLYLFGRGQDYGWAHAEPLKVVSTRNHLRLWKAPFQVNGETIWVGAATHDIGFERDQRNDNVTHKIDPDIDLERDYVEKTLLSTGQIAEVSHFTPENPLKEAHTATGGTFHSNGQVLILKLTPFKKDPAGQK
ncbi:MAG TPA: LssY C-terminal domain-containing protein, partial [Candidatus Eremiobacteraceae bacterium]|nr:LssY C-terminal domain-containing protein [Candidatus Eremiobacteraceae bacterium]